MTSATTTPTAQPHKNPFVSPFTKRQMVADLTRIQLGGGTAWDAGNTLYKKYGYAIDGYDPSLNMPDAPSTPDAPSRPFAVDMPIRIGMGGASIPMSFSLGALQGLTIGTGIAGVGSILGWASGKGAQAGRDEMRQLYAGLQEVSPGMTMAGEVTGGAALAMGTGAGPAIARGMAGASTMGRVGAGLGLGAAGSAGYAAGEARGGLAERGEAGLMAAVPGAAIGAVTAVSPAVALMTMGAGVGAMVGGEGNRLMGATAGAGLALGAVKQGGNLAQRFSDRLRGYAHDVGSVPVKARDFLYDPLIREHGSIENVIRRIDLAEARGELLTVADLLGPDGPAIIAQLAKHRSPAVQRLVSALESRDDGQQGRIMQEMVRSFRVGSANAHDAADAVVARMDDESDPLFQASWTDRVPVDDRLRSLLAVPQVREAYGRGRTLDALRVADESGGERGTMIPELPDDLADLTDLPVRALHYIKRGVRDMATGADQSGKGLSQEAARPLYGLATQIRDLAAEASDNYRSATNIFRGHAQSLEAIQMGKGGASLLDNRTMQDVGDRPRFVNRTPEQVAADLREMTPSQRELYITGALQDVDEFLSSQAAHDPKMLAQLGLHGDTQRDTRFTKALRALIDDDDAAAELLARLRNQAQLVHAPGRTGASTIREFNELTGQAEWDTRMTSGLGVPLGRVASAVGTMMRAVRPATTGPDARVGEMSDEISNLLLGGVNGYGDVRAVVNGIGAAAARVRVRAPKPYRPLVPLLAGQQVGDSRNQ